MTDPISQSKNPPPGLAFNKVSFSLNWQTILRELTFQAPLGEITVLFGPSGAGKTTVLRLIAGLETLEQGAIFWSGETFQSSPKPRLTKNVPVGFCFQDDALWPGLRVDEHLRVALQSRGVHGAERDDKVVELLQDFGLAAFARRFPSQLSGGERKRLGFARALALDPPILLLDEPLSSIEGPMRRELSERILASNTPDRSVIFVTHQLEEALSLSTRLVVMNQGRVLREGTPAEVYQFPKSQKVAELMGYSNFFEVWNENGRLITPFGQIAIKETPKKPAKAAAHTESLLAVPDNKACGEVMACRFAGRYCILQIKWDEQRYTAHAPNWIAPQTRVRLQFNAPPVVLDE